MQHSLEMISYFLIEAKVFYHNVLDGEFISSTKK